MYQPADGMRPASPPLNPWNPYLRSYGRMYHPYGLGVNQYENPPRNWMVSNEPSQRPLHSYQTSRIHLVPPFREFNPSLSAMPLGESMRRTLSRPRSNRSFLHYRSGAGGANSAGSAGGGGSAGVAGSAGVREMTENENISGYSSLPVIEISSDEDEPRSMPVELATRPDSNNSSTIRPIAFNHSNKENIITRSSVENAIRSPSRRTPAESKLNIHAQIRRTSFEDSNSTSANHHHHHNQVHHHHHNHHNHHHHQQHHQPDEALALNLSNRMKRRHSPPQSQQSKYCRIDTEYQNSRQTPGTIDSHNGSGDESPAQKKPNINEIDTTINSTSANILQPIDNDENHIEQKFKIRIKREFKTEANSNSENVDSETVVDTKEHLQPLIADIKQE